MTKRIITRGNTTFLSFVFYDEDDAIAVCTSAEVQLTYPGTSNYETEVVTLTNASNVWSGEWVSTSARAGWVEYHAHALATLGDYAQDGRFRLTANRASFDHDTLATNATPSDYEDAP